MILLLGGTSETSILAEALASAGFRVLVSTATEEPLRVGDDPKISRRWGVLDREAMKRVLVETTAKAIVDATHPYATAVRSTARAVAEDLGIPYFTWVRPPDLEDASHVTVADNHEAAARIACSYGRPVLLTTGSRNLEPYVREAGRARVRLVARVLDSESSIAACRRAGILSEDILTGRGPFTIAENLATIAAFGIGTLVTKDSGAAGGVREKVEACRRTGCRVVVVRRPAETAEASYATVQELVHAVTGACATVR
jgi:precorrin-6A/cobalt-precorrin-6A reductase